MLAETRWKLLCVGLVVGLATSYAQAITMCVTGFETGEGFEAGDEVLFQAPGYSGTTRGIVCNPDASGECQETDPLGNKLGDSQVVAHAKFAGSQSHEIYFLWKDPNEPVNSSGVRATTYAADNLDRPSVHLGGNIRFKMALVAYQSVQDLIDDPGNPNAAGSTILMAMGIRETGNDVAQGETDTGTGDIEIVYLPGSEVIPAVDSNGMIDPDWPPGGKRFTATATWPPPAGDWVSVEFDLGNTPGNRILGFVLNGDGIITAGDGKLDATTNGLGDSVNRGILESLMFTNDPGDAVGKFWYIYIDDVEFWSPVPDSSVPPPSVNPPVSETDTTVTVSTKYNPCGTGEDVDQADLYISTNGGASFEWLQMQIPSGGEAAFTGLTLNAGDVLKATQTHNGVTSALSLPVIVFAEGTSLVDNFDGYSSQVGLNAYWHDSISNPSPSSAFVHLTTGNAASCENLLREQNPSGADAARLYRHIGDVYGTDATPLWVTWHFQHRGSSGGAGERTKFELARMSGGTWSSSVADRLSGTTGIVLDNGPTGIPDEILNQYDILLIGGSNGFYAGNQGQVAPTGVQRERDVWHKFQIEVRSEVINYYIDDVSANPVDTNGGGPLFPGGVPRPADSIGQPYNFVIIGQGYSNNGPAMMFDNVAVDTNGMTFGVGGADVNPVTSPDVVGPLYPNNTLVTVENVNSNATEVDLYADGDWLANTSGIGAFLDNTATFIVSPLPDGTVITATQTLDVASLVESCFSAPVVVGVPSVTVESPLVPSQATVKVSNLEEGLASVVTVYRDLGGGSKVQIAQELNPATDPVTVTVAPLGFGDTIVATQTINGVESPDSAGVVVGVPAPTLPGPLLPGMGVVTVTNVHPFATDITVYVDTIVGGHVSTTGVTEFDVPVDPVLSNLQEVQATQTIDGFVSDFSNLVLVAGGFCNVVFSSDMVSSNAWTKVYSGIGVPPNDASADFGYDYSADGIPSAPSGSDTLGLKMEANLVAGGTYDTVACFPTGLNMTGNYQLQFDFWVNYALASEFQGEFIGGGVGYNGQPMLHGATFMVDGDGGTTYDYRMYKDTVRRYPDSTDAFYNAGSMDASDPYYTGAFPGQAPPAAQGQPPGTNPDGSQAFAWRRMVITAVNFDSVNTVSFEIDGVPIGTLDANAGGAVPTEGFVKVWYSDQFMSTFADMPHLQFGLIDNVVVVTEHTPGTAGDWDNDLDVDLDDFRAFEDCLTGPNASPDPVLGVGCRQACLIAFDSEPDGDIDLDDFGAFQGNF